MLLVGGLALALILHRDRLPKRAFRHIKLIGYVRYIRYVRYIELLTGSDCRWPSVKVGNPHG